MEPLRILSPIHKATRQMEIYLEQKIKPLGVSTAEGHILTYLLSYAPCSIGQLVRVFGFKRSTLTSILDRLEKRGLIRRQLHPKDRRSWIVAIQPKGRKIAGKLRKIVEEFEAEISSNLDPGDIERFSHIMEAIGKVSAIQFRKKPEA